MKKRGKEIDIIPYNKKILSSNRYKTPKNYRDNWRPKVANNESKDAFFLQWNGKPITDKYVRDHLSPTGKIITKNPKFKPYNMRHTFATYYYQLTKNLKKVSKKLGHTKTQNTDKYVSIAEDLEEQFEGKNLFNIALKPHNIIAVRGKQKQQVTFIYPQKQASIESNYNEKQSMGLAEPLPAQQIYLLSFETLFRLKSKFSSLSKFFFSFFCSNMAGCEQPSRRSSIRTFTILLKFGFASSFSIKSFFFLFLFRHVTCRYLASIQQY